MLFLPCRHALARALPCGFIRGSAPAANTQPNGGHPCESRLSLTLSRNGHDAPAKPPKTSSEACRTPADPGRKQPLTPRTPTSPESKPQSLTTSSQKACSVPPTPSGSSVPAPSVPLDMGQEFRRANLATNAASHPITPPSRPLSSDPGGPEGAPRITHAPKGSDVPFMNSESRDPNP